MRNRQISERDGLLGIEGNRRNAAARSARHADRHDAGPFAQAAAAPFAGEDLIGDMRRAETLGNAVDVVAFEAVGLVPFVSTETFAPVGAIGAFEPVDWLAVLEPLH